MGELTLGQYYPVDSVLHRLDPRVKFVGTIVYIVGLFQVRGVFGYLFAAAVLLLAAAGCDTAPARAEILRRAARGHGRRNLAAPAGVRRRSAGDDRGAADDLRKREHTAAQRGEIKDGAYTSLRS